MKLVVANLSAEDMLDIAAYVSSRPVGGAPSTTLTAAAR
jgi:cytochrome c553